MGGAFSGLGQAAGGIKSLFESGADKVFGDAESDPDERTFGQNALRSAATGVGKGLQNYGQQSAAIQNRGGGAQMPQIQQPQLGQSAYGQQGWANPFTPPWALNNRMFFGG